jgi:hypothetical protein
MQIAKDGILFGCDELFLITKRLCDYEFMTCNNVQTHPWVIPLGNISPIFKER